MRILSNQTVIKADYYFITENCSSHNKIPKLMRVTFCSSDIIAKPIAKFTMFC